MGEEQRKHKRINIPEPLTVVDTLSKDVLGMVANLSVEGMMLMGKKALVEGAVYQVELPISSGGAELLSVGVECLWVSEAGGEDQSWSGFRIIDISDDAQSELSTMIASF